MRWLLAHRSLGLATSGAYFRTHQPTLFYIKLLFLIVLPFMKTTGAECFALGLVLRFGFTKLTDVGWLGHLPSLL